MTSSPSKASLDVVVVVGSPGFSSSPDSANSGAVFLYSYSTFVSSKPAQPSLIDTIHDVTSPHSFFGHNFHFTSDVAFIAAVTPTLSGVVYYYEKDSVTSSFVRKEILTSALPPHPSSSFSFTPSLPFLDGFGSSLLSIQATITVTRKHVSANHSLDTTFTPHHHNLRRLDETEEDEYDEEGESPDVTPSALPSSPPTTSSTSTTTVKSSSTEHIISLLLVGAPSTSLTPRRGSGGKVEEGGVVYVFSNHRHVIRNLTCSLSPPSLTSPEIEAYFHSLCTNTSSLGDWEVVDVFSADDIAQLPHAHYGSQLAADVTYSSSPSLLISAPFALPPSSSSGGTRGSGLVYVSDNLRHTLSLLGDDISKLLNGESSDNASQAPSSGAGSGDDVFSVLWKALTSTDGVIVTATCLPALFIATLALYLYLRPPLVGGAVYSKMMSPTSSNTSSKAVKRQSEEEREKIQQLSYYHHLVHSLARAKTSLPTSSESNEEVSEVPPSKWRMWWHSKYDELNTASDVITSALPEDPSHLSPPRSSSSHSTSVKEEEVEEQIYDTSYPAADVISAKKKTGGRATRWTSNPLHRETRHSQEEEEGSAVTTSTSSFSTMTHFIGQWVPTLSTANERKAVEEVQALPR